MGQSWRTWVPDQAAADAPALTGPEQPLLMLEADPPLPIVRTALAAEMWVVGAHGGAGGFRQTVPGSAFRS